MRGACAVDLLGAVIAEGEIQLSRPHYYLGDNTVLTNINHGPYMFLDTRDPVNLAILLTGDWEKWITNIMLSIVKPGMTVLDIGAHTGFFSILSGMLVGPTGQVHAFEPNPFHHRNLLKSISFNGMYGRVHLHRVALSNQRGETEFQTIGDGGTSIQFLGIEAINEPTKFKVKQGLLTDFLPSLKADVIKIDVDGAEPLIMDSVFEVIDHNPSIIILMEYLPVIWRGGTPGPILQKFVQRGFRFHILFRDGQVVPTDAAGLEAHQDPDQLDLLIVR